MKNSRKIKSLGARDSARLLAAVVVCCAAAAQESTPREHAPPAQTEPEEPARLEDLVVTGSRVSAAASTVPASVTVITADDIRQSGATTMVDVLERLGGLHFRSYSGNASQAQVDIRGFGEGGHLRTLVLLDGHRINRPDMAGINWLELPLGNVERIEVVRGAQSALYGNNAVGGVINVITRTGEAEPTSPTPSLSASFGSNETVNYRAGLSGNSNGLRYALDAELNGTEGYRDHSAYDAESLSLSLAYDVNEIVALRGGISLVKTNYDLPGGLNRAEMERDRTQVEAARKGDDGSGKYINTSLGADVDLGAWGTLDLGATYRLSDLEWFMGGTFGFNEIGTLALTPKYTLESELFGRRSRLTLGGDYYRDKLDFHGKELWGPGTRATVAAALVRKTTGIYLREELHLRDDLILSAAARRERTSLDVHYRHLLGLETPYSQKEASDEDAYSLGLSWRPAEAWRLFCRWEKLFRQPTTDEIARYQGAGAGFNNDLAAETGNSYEVGLEWIGTEKLRATVTFFRIEMDGEIVFDGAENVNSEDRTERDGIEVSANWKPKAWLRLRTSCTYIRARMAGGEFDGKEIQLVPRRKLAAGMEIDLPMDFIFQADVTATDSFYQGTGANGYAEPRVPGHAVLDLALHYRPALASCTLDVFLAVDNVLNKEYVSFAFDGTYYPSPERLFRGGIQVNF